MDPDVVRQVKSSNEAAVALVTVLAAGEDLEAISMIVSDPVYREKATCLALGSLAVSAIKTLAEMLEVEPLEIVQVAGLSAAEFGVSLEKKIDEE